MASMAMLKNQRVTNTDNNDNNNDNIIGYIYKNMGPTNN